MVSPIEDCDLYAGSTFVSAARPLRQMTREDTLGPFCRSTGAVVCLVGDGDLHALSAFLAAAATLTPDGCDRVHTALSARRSGALIGLVEDGDLYALTAVLSAPTTLTPVNG